MTSNETAVVTMMCPRHVCDANAGLQADKEQQNDSCKPILKYAWRNAGCKMTGNEAVVVTMLTPKGVSLVQVLAFKQAEGIYEDDITSLEVLYLCSPLFLISRAASQRVYQDQ